jgi:hypothetical protein
MQSVGENNTHRRNTSVGITVIGKSSAHQKKVSRGNITEGINPSVITLESTDGITDGQSVGNYGMACNFVATLCVIPTDITRR